MTAITNHASEANIMFGSEDRAKQPNATCCQRVAHVECADELNMIVTSSKRIVK